MITHRRRAPVSDRSNRLGTLLIALLLGIAGAGSSPAAQPTTATGAPHTNRLIDSNDPYLLLHAHNPVDWYPWGPEALEKAKRENKPIFLSVGYSTCYWCHVAEETIYSRQEFADLMNPWFVNIKVDREQRPDIDRLYMAATQAMTGRGGWPNNVFLTPDLKPFFAGSYFPPHGDEFGRPGFDSILRSIHETWQQDPARLLETADKMIAALRALHAVPAHGREAFDFAALLDRAAASWRDRADSRHGGFGAAKGPRFPQQPVVMLLMSDPDQERIGPLLHTLDAMAAGGLYDHLAGGFHRYAVEPTWSIPHFEKMLGDNAQLLTIYAQAFKLTGEPRYRAVAREVAGYLTREMMSPHGGFYTAQDAAVDGAEGVSYLWTEKQIVAVLGRDAAANFLANYALTPMPHKPAARADEPLSSEDMAGVLRRRVPDGRPGITGQNMRRPMADYGHWRKQLLEARNLRRQPARDEKLVVALNGLAIEAFARAGGWLGMPQYIATARRSAEHIWHTAYDPHSGLKHEIFRDRAQTEAYLDDYALLGLGFLALHDVTADGLWLRRAGQLADDLLARFRRADGSLATTTAENDLPMPPPEDGDNIYPSGSSAAVDLLLRLERSTGEARYLNAAREIVAHLGPRLDEAPESWPSLLRALTENDLTLSAGGSAAALATEAVVRVSAEAKSGPVRDQVVVTLQIADGYHVNANPASYDYLIATGVTFDGMTPTRIIYPDAILFKPAFAPDGLKVYEGKVTIDAWFPKATFRLRRPTGAVVSTQACDSEVCLPPAKIAVKITGAKISGAENTD